jgi:hypothetical protein
LISVEEAHWKITAIDTGMISGQINLPVSMDLSSLDWQQKFQCYQQTKESQQFYNEHNSSIWQMFDESPAWVHEIAQLVPRDFTHHVVSVIRIDPGNTIPLHRDKHYLLQEKFGAGETWRYLIFLEDWKIGHYFEIEKTPLLKWRAGDFIKFSRKNWHVGGNMGLEPFYSAQITVT